MKFDWPRPERAVLLFDIDGTLVRGHGAGRRLMEDAFAEVLGLGTASLAEVPFHGNTDPAIVRAGLDALGFPASDALVTRILGDYVARLERAVTDARPFEALPGAKALCDILRGRGHRLGLGTGNVEVAAWLKVRAVALGDAFDYGGFGSDHHERSALLAVGARRGAALLGQAYEACEVVVIGDTLRDIAAARAIGARVLAVATGGDDAETLAAAGPDMWVTTLADARLV
jgi:phosphoglycolate phosphatase-like HAD superfamily hydrolase